MKVATRRKKLWQPVQRILAEAPFRGMRRKDSSSILITEYPKKLSNRLSLLTRTGNGASSLPCCFASGVRLSVVNLDRRYQSQMMVMVTRKGGKRDSVNVAAFYKPYLEDYLQLFGANDTRPKRLIQLLFD